MKTRDELINLMKINKEVYFSAVVKEDDKLGVLVHLTPAGKLVDPWSKAYNKKATFWGYLDHIDGKPVRRSFNDN